MQAYEVQGLGWDNLRQVERRRPALAADEVRIRVKAAGINYRDVALITGEYLPEMPRPYVPLSEGSGEVIEIGSAVKDMSAGEMVLGHYTSAWLAGEFHAGYHASKIGGPIDGWLSEEIVLPRSALLRVPPGWSYEHAAALAISALTAWNALGDNSQLAGKRVLIEGSGNVSLMALQLAVAAGAFPVVLTSQSANRTALETLGACAVVGPGPGDERRQAIAEATDGHGIDIAVDVVGGGQLLDVVLPSMADNGDIAIVGFLESGRVSGELVGPLLKRLIRLRGVSVGSKVQFEALLAFMSEHDVRPLIGQRYAFDRALQAMAGKEHRPLGKRVMVMP